MMPDQSSRIGAAQGKRAVLRHRTPFAEFSHHVLEDGASTLHRYPLPDDRPNLDAGQ
jgi:hypothetical protein